MASKKQEYELSELIESVFDIGVVEKAKTPKASKPSEIPLGGVTPATLESAQQTYIATPSASPWGAGAGAAPSFTDAIYKAVIPAFLYKPPFGYPLFKDIPEIRRMAASPYVSMITNTVCNEIASLDWKIEEAEGDDINVPDAVIKKT